MKPALPPAILAELQALLTASVPVGMPTSVVLSPRSRRLRLVMSGPMLELRLPPRVSATAVAGFLRDSRAWIGAQHERHSQLQHDLQDRLQLTANGCLPLWGQVRHWQCRSGPARVDLDGDPICIGLDPSHPRFEPRLRQLLRSALRRRLFDRARTTIAELADTHGLRPGQLRIRAMRSLWGSLSPRGDISLNLGLIFLPADMADYVCAHELAHLQHRDHSPAFWQAVGRLYPDWRQARRALNAEHAQVQALLDGLA